MAGPAPGADVQPPLLESDTAGRGPDGRCCAREEPHGRMTASTASAVTVDCEDGGGELLACGAVIGAERATQRACHGPPCASGAPCTSVDSRAGSPLPA